MLTHLLLLPSLYFVFAEVDRLDVRAEPAAAVLAVQPGGRNFVSLPELEFALSITTHCASGGAPESLSVTIADTRRTLRAEEMAGAETHEVKMRVTADQLAPFALREFCVDALFEGETLLLASAMTAHVSLRCRRDEEQSIVFAAEPLDIRVDCVRPASAGAEPGSG